MRASNDLRDVLQARVWPDSKKCVLYERGSEFGCNVGQLILPDEIFSPYGGGLGTCTVTVIKVSIDSSQTSYRTVEDVRKYSTENKKCNDGSGVRMYVADESKNNSKIQALGLTAAHCVADWFKKGEPFEPNLRVVMNSKCVTRVDMADSGAGFNTLFPRISLDVLGYEYPEAFHNLDSVIDDRLSRQQKMTGRDYNGNDFAILLLGNMTDPTTLFSKIPFGQIENFELFQSQPEIGTNGGVACDEFTAAGYGRPFYDNYTSEAQRKAILEDIGAKHHLRCTTMKVAAGGYGFEDTGTNNAARLVGVPHGRADGTGTAKGDSGGPIF